MLYNYKAIVREVYDGDTITVDIDLGLKTWILGEKVRLFGINAPELRGETWADGIASRDYLRTLILGRVVLLTTVKDSKGKYGRYLGIVYLGEDKQDINAEMVRSGHAIHADY